MKHRPDIDGLRAIAVWVVVLLHAGVPGFAGGFIGVDAFFVISGFLITRLLVDDLATSCFSIARFYERRARRILPALFAMLLFTCVAAYKLLLPDATRDYSKSLIATLFFSSNMFFTSQKNYFSAVDATKPLLHTWSLAVEEQFYIFYPVFLVLVARYFRKRFAMAIGFALTLSFAWSTWALRAHHITAFYAAPGRAWELLIGGLLAVELIPKPKRGRATQGLGLLGLALILYSVFAFSGKTAFPGPNALYPCLGAALLIYTGACGTVVSRVLSARPIVFMGLISYSLYLWHWVLFVFVRYYAIRPLTVWEITATIAASVLAATLSWQFVENPFRGKRAVGTRSWIFAGAAACTLLFAVYGGVALGSGGFPGRFNPSVLASINAAQAVWPRREECMAEPCRLGAPDADVSFLLWGDSHAGAISPMIDQQARAGKLAGIAAIRVGCPPLLGARLGPECSGFDNATISLIKTAHIRNVLLAARWGLYAEGPIGKFENHAPELDSLAHATLQELHSLDLNVVILASVPETGIDVPSALGRVAEFGSSVQVAPRYSDFMRRQARAFQILRRWADEYSMKIVYPHEILCDQQVCSVVRDGWYVYSDEDHLSLRGATYLAPLFQQISAGWQGKSQMPAY